MVFQHRPLEHTMMRVCGLQSDGNPAAGGPVLVQIRIHGGDARQRPRRPSGTRNIRIAVTPVSHPTAGLVSESCAQRPGGATIRALACTAVSRGWGGLVVGVARGPPTRLLVMENHAATRRPSRLRGPASSRALRAPARLGACVRRCAGTRFDAGACVRVPACGCRCLSGGWTGRPRTTRGPPTSRWSSGPPPGPPPPPSPHPRHPLASWVPPPPLLPAPAQNPPARKRGLPARGFGSLPPRRCSARPPAPMRGGVHARAPSTPSRTR